MSTRLLDCVQYLESKLHTSEKYELGNVGEIRALPKLGAALADLRYRDKKRRKTVFDLGHSVHESQYSNVQRPVNPKTGRSIEPARNFEVTLEPDNFTEEKSVDPEFHEIFLTLKKDRYALFENYQKSVHHEADSEISRSGFKRFLCSGLKRTVQVHNGQELKIGSYHQCYRLDGRLVAIGVLDLLPHCVSSVYLVYV